MGFLSLASCLSEAFSSNFLLLSLARLLVIRTSSSSAVSLALANFDFSIIFAFCLISAWRFIFSLAGARRASRSSGDSSRRASLLLYFPTLFLSFAEYCRLFLNQFELFNSSIFNLSKIYTYYVAWNLIGQFFAFYIL